MDIQQKAYIPPTWSNPKSIISYFNAARENLLNIIPPETFHSKYLKIPSRTGDLHYISDPELLRIVFKSEWENYPKSRSYDLLLEPTVPRSIFIAHGERWKQLHEMMIPVFTKPNIAQFEGDIKMIVQQYLSENDLSKYDEKDITLYLQDLTFKIISQILLSDQNNEDLELIRPQLEEFMGNAARLHLLDIFGVRYRLFPNYRKITQYKLTQSIKKRAHKIVLDRLAKPASEKPDFLELLIEAYQLRNPLPTKTREAHIGCVRDNLVTFIVAGHETSALTLAWGLYALSYHPATQEKIAHEANLPFQQMTQTSATNQEIMRLYPTAPMIVRRSIKNIQLGNHNLKRNEALLIPIIAIHRHRDYWQQPDEFVPDRFLNFTPTQMTYMPFGAGPRICIGASLANMEINIILTEILNRFQFSPSIHTPQAFQLLTMRSANGIQTQINRRLSNIKIS